MDFELEKAVEILSRTPATLGSLLEGLSPYWTKRGEGTDGWSPFDIVGHLLHGEETDWIPRLKIILEQRESKTFAPFDRFAQFEKFEGKRLPELLLNFAEARSRNLQTLSDLELKPDQLGLRGTHPELGTVTARQLLATWVVHDLAHIAQIARVMARGYTEAVGPWGKYLSILTR
ncbi:MAG: DinB family protein [Gemmatimonadota bacterium]|nr:MAG: DinB family protein [Gemmatimonadota bacterium]